MAEPDTDWLGACRRATAAIQAVLSDAPDGEERLEETGEVGEGGDRTLVIDQAAEDAVFEQLEALHADGQQMTVLSEERGIVELGREGALVVVDPLDGSTNAKRGLPHHALSIAVADGPTMADVRFAYVFDFGPGEEFHATRGGGAFLDGTRLDPTLPERHDHEGRLELLAVESADPRWVAASADALSETARRLRILGTIAAALCQCAAGRVDGFCTLWRTRSVDVAAAQLIAREGGAHVCFPGYDDGPLAAPLDLEPRAPAVAARSAAGLERLLAVPSVTGR